jgi:hypothetical protein
VLSSAFLTSGLAVAVVFVRSGASDGTEALRLATQKTLSAPYVVVSHADGRRFLRSRRLTVIKSRVRVIAWTTATEEFTWRATKRCYRRSTRFNREDVRQAHAAIAPRHLSAVRLEQRNGVTVLSDESSTLTRQTPSSSYV